MAKSARQLKQSARRAEKRENWSRAIELYRDSLRLAEQQDDASLDLSLYNRIGDLHRRLGRTEEAVEFYLEAVDRYAEQGLHTGAVALCNKILRLSPDQIAVHRSLGRLHAATGLVAEARNSFREYARRMEEEGDVAGKEDALLELADLTEDVGLFLEVVDEMLESGRESEACDRLVRLWEERQERDASGALDEALRERLATLVPDHELEASASEAAAEPAVEGDGDEPAAAEDDGGAPDAPAREAEGESEPGAEELSLSDLMLDSRSSGGAGSEPGSPDAAEAPATAEPAGTDAAEDDAEDGAGQPSVAACLRQADVLRDSGQREAAVRRLEGALRELVDRPAVALLRIVDRLLEHRPGHPPYLYERGRLLAEAGRGAEAVEAYLDLAHTLEAEERTDAAATVYRRVLEIDPGHEDARHALGEGAAADAPASAVGEETDAVDLGERLRRRLGEESAAGAGAFARRPESDFDDMLAGFRAQVEETSGEAEPEAHVEFGVALRQMGLVEDAIREFQAAARAPDPPLRAFELLGGCFLDQELHGVAIRVLNRALRMPGYSDVDLLGVLYQLGVAYQVVEKQGEALDCFERIYSIDIDFRDVADRMESVRHDL